MTKKQITKIFADLGVKQDELITLEDISYIALFTNSFSIPTKNKTYLFDSINELFYEYLDGKVVSCRPYAMIYTFMRVSSMFPSNPHLRGIL